METELLLFIFYMSLIGAGIGTFTGLVPGIHVNTLAALMLASYQSLEDLLCPMVPEGSVPVCLSACIVSAAVVHSFVDYVPSVFIGAPDPDDTLSMLPGHRLLSEGRGMAAVRSAAIGSCVGTCSAIVAAIPLRYLLSFGLGDYFDSITAVVLSVVILLMIFREKDLHSAIWATVILTVSGALGLAVMDLDIPCGGIIGGGTLLFPLLTGLFGIPSMIQSLSAAETVPQSDDERYPVGPVPGLKGLAVGMLTGWFPGITATTGAVLAGTVLPERRPEGFIAMTASIGSAAAVVMIVTMNLTGKGRSGTMLTVCDILGDSAVGDTDVLLILLLASCFAAFLGYNATIACGKMMSGIVSRINTKHLNIVCLMLVITLVAVMTGPYGIAILAVSAAAGFLPMYASVGRIHLTGCMLIPTLLTYLGIRDTVLASLCL